MFKRILLLLGVVAALLASVSAPAQAQGGSLSELLAQTPDNGTSRSVIWYGAPGDLEQVLGISVNSQSDVNALRKSVQLTYLYEIGNLVYYSSFIGLEYAADWQQTFAINGYTVNRELTVGGSQNQDQFAILQGSFDVNAISGALQGLGYQQAQAGNQTIWAIGADYGANSLAGARYNRLFVSDSLIIAAPSTNTIAQVPLLGGGTSLANDAAYSSMAAALESGGGLVQGTRLLSAVLYDGGFLTNLANRSLNGASPAQFGLNDPLPAYQNAAIGYHRSKTDRALLIVLVYGDENTANVAGNALVSRMQNYISTQSGQPLFVGWQFSGGTAAIPGGALAVVAATIPSDSDVAWVRMVQDQDIAFLAPQ